MEVPQSGHERKKKGRSSEKAMLDAIFHYKFRIEHEKDDDKVLHALKKLRSYPIDSTALKHTNVYQAVSPLKNRNGEVGVLAQSLVNDWRQIGKSKHAKSPSSSTCRKLTDNDGSDSTASSQSPSKKIRVQVKLESETSDNGASPAKLKAKSLAPSPSKNGHVRQVVQPTSESALTSKETISKVTTSVLKTLPGHSASEPRSVTGTSRPKKDKTSKKLVDSGGDGFNASMASFEDCLGLNDLKGRLPSSSLVNASSKSASAAHKKAKRKSDHKSKSPPADLIPPPPPPPPPKRTSPNLPSLLAVDPRDPESACSSASTPSSSSSSKNTIDSHVDILSSLPAIQPDYKPLRYTAPDSPPSKIKRGVDFLVDGTTFMSPRNTRTQVFSGRRSHHMTEVPSLLSACSRVLQENVGVLSDLMYAPYKHLKPALLRCNPDRLLYLEEMNPYILDETDELWKVHCQREFKGYEPDEFETWRELYYRMSIDRTSRLRSITANISASMAKAVPVRQTKMAFVDGTVKPPRQVARQQAKYGTAGGDRHGKVAEAATALVKLSRSKVAGGSTSSSSSPVSSVATKASSDTTSSSSSSSSFQNGPSTSQAKAVKKVAPLMQKTLKFMKNRFRR